MDNLKAPGVREMLRCDHVGNSEGSREQAARVTPSNYEWESRWGRNEFIDSRLLAWPGRHAQKPAVGRPGDPGAQVSR